MGSEGMMAKKISGKKGKEWMRKEMEVEEKRNENLKGKE